MSADSTRRPVVLAFAGPNGSGKSTLTRGMPVLGTHVNADDLKRECNLTDLEAARQAEALRNELLSKKADFSFETVLLLPQLISVCDKILVYDNSDTPKLIYHKEKAFTQYYPNALWPEDKLRTLLGL